MLNVLLLNKSTKMLTIFGLEYGTVSTRFLNNFLKEFCPLEATQRLKVEAILLNIYQEN